MKLSDATALWWAENAGLWAPRTIDSYAIARTSLEAELGDVDVGTLTARAILDLLLVYRDRDYSIGYVRIRYGVLKAVLDVAVLRGALAVNPAGGVWRTLQRAMPRVDDGVRILDPGTAGPLVAGVRAVNPHIGWVATTYQQTGMRLCEALGLQAQDVDFAGHVVTVRRQWQGAGLVREMTKGKRRRILDLSGRLEDTLRAAIDASQRLAADRGFSREPAWVFRSSRGTPWSPGYVCRVFRDVGKQLGLRVYNSHAIRHSVCTAFAYDGMPLADLRDWMGHASIVTTQRYLHSRRRSQRDRLGSLDDM